MLCHAMVMSHHRVGQAMEVTEDTEAMEVMEAMEAMVDMEGYRPFGAVGGHGEEDSQFVRQAEVSSVSETAYIPTLDSCGTHMPCP